MFKIHIYYNNKFSTKKSYEKFYLNNFKLQKEIFHSFLTKLTKLICSNHVTYNFRKLFVTTLAIMLVKLNVKK